MTTNKLHEELTLQELVSLTREEKDAMNATMIGMNNIGLLAKHGHLSMILSRLFAVIMSAYSVHDGAGL